MRLASSEVKRLLADGQRLAVTQGGVRLSMRSLPGTNKVAHGRIALAVPKRQLKRAVDRNRVKRILRESFRHQSADTVNLDMLVTLNSAPTAMMRHAIRQAADAIFQKRGKMVQAVQDAAPYAKPETQRT